REDLPVDTQPACAEPPSAVGDSRTLGELRDQRRKLRREFVESLPHRSCAPRPLRCHAPCRLGQLRIRLKSPNTEISCKGGSAKGLPTFSCSRCCAALSEAPTHLCLMSHSLAA